MKKILIVLAILTSLPSFSQLALKGGVSYAEKELTNFVVTGQFYKDLLVISGDLYIPTQKDKKVAESGRIGLGLGSERIRFVADIGGMYENNLWRCGFGLETNLRLSGSIGIFGRWSRTYPISNDTEHKKILWCNSRSDLSVGIVIDLISGRCY